MENNVGNVHQLGHEPAVKNSVAMELEGGVKTKGGKVFDTAGGKIINRNDLVSQMKQPLGEMRSYKSGASRNQATHVRGLLKSCSASVLGLASACGGVTPLSLSSSMRKGILFIQIGGWRSIL
jgi:hypothetical protein